MAFTDTLVSKFFYVWTWPLTRWVMFRCMSSEHAHKFGMRGIWMVGKIEVVWEFARDVLIVLALVAVAVLCKTMPRWFQCESPPETWLE